MLKDLLIALSMANLWFIDVWKLFLVSHSTAYPYYHWKLNPAPLLIATILDVLLLAAILFLSITVVRRSRKTSLLTAARLIFAIVFVLLMLNLVLIAARNPPLGPLVRTLTQQPGLLFEWRGTTTIYFWLAVIGLGLGCLGITVMIHSLIYRRRQLIKVSATICLILSPFAFMTLAQAALQWLNFRSGEQFREPSKAEVLPQTSSRRVLWLVFDEFDFKLSFLERPATLELPEFDRLRKESIFASNSYPPAGDTEISLPAMITGRLISRVNRIAPNELELTFADNNQSLLWSKAPNVFSKARAMNANSGLAGWYHPYCRVIEGSLNRCSWETTSLLLLPNSELVDLIAHSTKISLPRSMARVAGSLLLPETFRVWSPRDPTDYRRYYTYEFDVIHQEAVAMASDPNLQLIFVHYPIPHPPGIYERTSKRFSLNSISGYLDNLALADHVLGELRRNMVEAGVWENTTVLISSDHSLRADRIWRSHPFWEPQFTKEDPLALNSASDERVPFIVKLAGNSEGITYDPALNTVLSQDLILAILSGEVSNAADVKEWLDRHRSIGESPYKEGEKQFTN